MSKIPELCGPPEIYYNAIESRKYDTNSRIQSIQREITIRCLDLLDLKSSGLILDIGCGTGISGSVLSDHNLNWIGLDISKDMLNICKEKDETNCVIKGDIGEGLCFQPGTFDGVISVSALQWLFQSYKNNHVPKKRIRLFFTSLFSICKPETKCVLQFYLKNKKDIEFLKNEALRAGFYGGINIDKPNTKHIKQYLILTNSYIKTNKIKKSNM